MKIVFVNYNLKTGGITSSLYNLLCNISINENLDIDLCLLSTSNDNQFDVPKNINVIYPSKLLDIYYRPVTDFMKWKKIFQLLLKIILKILCILLGSHRTLKIIMKGLMLKKEYDIAISYSNDIQSEGFVGGCNDFTLRCIKATKKIGWVHNDPIKLGFTYNICKKTYENFDQIVNVSYDCKKKFDNIIPEFSNKSVVVYNMFLENEIKILSSEFNPFEKKEDFKFVTVARVENKQKRLDRVIDVASKLIQEGYVNFKWFILGEGPDLDEMRELVKKYNLTKNVKFLGNVVNPYPYIKNADVFILTSAYESYGMVIKEALLLRTPVITTEYSAAYEIIKDNIGGIICENDTEKLFYCIKNSIFKTKEIFNLTTLSSSEEDVALNQFFKLIGCD